MASTLSQISAVSVMNIKGIGHRFWPSLATVLGIAVVVAVMLAFLSMAEGFDRTVAGSGSNDVALILRAGSQAEINSTLSREEIRILVEAPGIARRNGQPLASSELYVVVDGIKRSTGLAVNLPFRGMDRAGIALRHETEIIAGRMFEPGRNEIVVGRQALAEFSGLELGSTVAFGKTRWKVVGIFAARGSVFESELWGDAQIIQSLFNRRLFQVLRVKLATPGDVSAIRSFIEADPRLNLAIETEADYFAGQSEQISKVIRVLGYPLAIAMALGALAGALNTMYTSVAARTREIATLRAIGFGVLATFVGTQIESLVLALVGGLLGCLAAYLLFNQLTAATLGQSFTQVVFSLHISRSLIWQGLALAVAVGLVGGLFPALRAVRQPLTAAFFDS
ncbi:MAG: ABC transporter permease [Sphingomonadales bacterium]